MPNSLKCRLKWLVRKGLLSEKDLSRIYTDNDVIEKLKTIKTEIEKLEYDDFDCNLVLPAWKVYDIIDNYIAELKKERVNEI